MAVPPSRSPPATAFDAPWPPRVLAVLLAAGWVLYGLDAPIIEDSLFWWVPKGLLIAEKGPLIVTDGPLPQLMREHLSPETLPPQWAGGLPDYAHPPLWYGWLALFLSAGATVQAVHLACLLPAVLAALGLVELGGRLGNRWVGLGCLALPPLLAQLWRPELDLPLLAIVPWAMVALVDGRWGQFALLGLLAPWLKEPGVLLVAPALFRAFRERRLRWQALTPLLGLGLWAILHPGGLAKPERLPDSPLSWLQQDLPLALRLVFFEQGRWVLLLGLPFVARRWPSSLPAQLCLVLVATWVVFFSLVGFFGGRDPGQPLTHVRYFLPGMAVGAVLLASRWPLLCLPGLLFVFARSPFGPEASLWGIDVGRAQALAAPVLARAPGDTPVWVGSYMAASLTQPWAGALELPLQGFRVYAQDTPPSIIPAGALLVVSDYGEPAGQLLRGLEVEREQRITVRQAGVDIYRVKSQKAVDPAPVITGPPTPRR